MTLLQNLEDLLVEDGSIAINRTRCGKVITCTVRNYTDGRNGPGRYGYGHSLRQAVHLAKSCDIRNVPSGKANAVAKQLKPKLIMPGMIL